MIKTHILLAKTTEGYRRFRVRVRVRVWFLLFYSELAPTDRDVTFSRLYLDGKNMRRQCQMNTLLSFVTSSAFISNTEYSLQFNFNIMLPITILSLISIPLFVIKGSTVFQRRLLLIEPFFEGS